MLPLAIQYGMPLDEFWHGDLRLLEAYQTAYRRDKSYTAWLQGAFVFEASSKAVANGNRTKRSDPVLEYSEWKDPIEKKINIVQEEVEQEFRNIQAEQNAWLHNMLHNK